MRHNHIRNFRLALGAAVGDSSAGWCDFAECDVDVLQDFKVTRSARIDHYADGPVTFVRAASQKTIRWYGPDVKLLGFDVFLPILSG